MRTTAHTPRRTAALRALAAGVLGVALVAGSSVGIAGAGEAPKKPASVVAVAKSSDDFSTLVEAVVTAELVKTLKSKGPFTVFAPTNDAFAKIPASDLEALLADQEALAGVLTYHVIEGKVPAKKLQPTQTVRTVQGEDITIDVTEDGNATITDAYGNTVNITATDLKAKNGVVHVIDGVLAPAS
jgi:uncharacterized surface protein with fasciclin (FAS1) repeats